MSIYAVADDLGSQQVVGMDVDEFAPAVAELLQQAVEHSNGELTIEWIFHKVRLSEWQLWLGFIGGDVRTVLVTSLEEYATGVRVCRIIALAGAPRYFAKTWEQIKLWALANGASKLEATCRPAVTRLVRRYGFFKTRDCVEFDLRRYLQ